MFLESFPFRHDAIPKSSLHNTARTGTVFSCQEARNNEGLLLSDNDNYDAWQLGQAGFRADSQLSSRDSLTLQGDLYKGNVGQQASIAYYAPPSQINVEGSEDVSGGNPEFRAAQIGGQCNEMLAQIQARDAALGEAHDSLERQVEERTAQLNAANADLEAFSYSVSHDLRAPLHHIDGFSKILMEDYGSKMEGEAQQYLKRIRSGAVRMAKLIEDLLKMAQIGRKELACVDTDLNSLLQDVRSELLAECEGRHIEWRIGELSTVECDPGLIKQVFANLISNAVKYTRRRETAVIEVGQAEQESAFVIFIRDNGAVSTNATSTSYLASSSACIAPRSSREPGSDVHSSAHHQKAWRGDLGEEQSRRRCNVLFYTCG